MSTIAPQKSTERLDFRISSEFKTLIMRAAAALGRTLTDYSISSLVETAKRDLQEQETRILSDRDREVFMAILSETEPNEAMKRAAARYKTIRVRGESK